jgi:hypothetical protein
MNRTQHVFIIGKKLKMAGKNTRDNLHVTCDCPKTQLGKLITWALIESQKVFNFLQTFFRSIHIIKSQKKIQCQCQILNDAEILLSEISTYLNLDAQKLYCTNPLIFFYNGELDHMKVDKIDWQ